MIKNYIKNIIKEIEMEKRWAEQENPIVGIAAFRTYTSCMGFGVSYMHPSTPYTGGPGFNDLAFHLFRNKDIEDSLDGKIKIFGVWFSPDDIYIFKDVELGNWKDLMSKKFGDIKEKMSEISQLYSNGLSVSYGLFGAHNNFHDKKLKKNIDDSIM